MRSRVSARRFSLSGGFDPRLLESELCDGGLAHPVFLDLARDGHGEVGREPDVARDLIGGNLAAAEVADLVDGRVLSLAKPDPRADFFAVLDVRNANHLNVGDFRMRIEELFDLARVHVLA